MQAIKIEQTKDSPLVILDHENNIFEISGESRPENVKIFYEPILIWLNDYKSYLFWLKENYQTEPKVNFKFCLEYFNSTSAKFLLDVLCALSVIKKEGANITIQWHYDEMDEDILDSGKEFALMANVDIDFVPNKTV